VPSAGGARVLRAAAQPPAAGAWYRLGVSGDCGTPPAGADRQAARSLSRAARSTRRPATTPAALAPTRARRTAGGVDVRSSGAKRVAGWLFRLQPDWRCLRAGGHGNPFLPYLRAFSGAHQPG
jgi:hypothetical protein